MRANESNPPVRSLVRSQWLSEARGYISECEPFRNTSVGKKGFGCPTATPSRGCRNCRSQNHQRSRRQGWRRLHKCVRSPWQDPRQSRTSSAVSDSFRSDKTEAVAACERTNKAPAGSRKSEIVRSLAVHTSCLRRATEWERPGERCGNWHEAGVRSAFIARRAVAKWKIEKFRAKRSVGGPPPPALARASTPLLCKGGDEPGIQAGRLFSASSEETLMPPV